MSRSVSPHGWTSLAPATADGTTQPDAPAVSVAVRGETVAARSITRSLGDGDVAARLDALGYR